MSLRGIGPEMNKFDQVSSDHHQMSLAAGGMSRGVYPEGSDCGYVQRDWVGMSRGVCLCPGVGKSRGVSMSMGWVCAGVAPTI